MPDRVAYAPPPWLVALLAVVAVAALVAAAGAAPAGRFFALVIAAGAGGEALRSALLRPTIAADADGLTVVSGLRRERFAWSQVVAVQPLSPPSAGGRLRRRASALEVDLGDRLLVVPGYRLGAPVDEVVATLAAPGGRGF